MKEKIEAKLKERKEQKENLIQELQKINQAKMNCTSKIVALTGSIEDLEGLLKQETGGE